MPIEEMSIYSRSERAKSDKTSMISKTSSARRVMHLELKALKEHEELQKRLEKLERAAKQLEREAKEKEIADLQEEVARKARIAEKEIEMAKVSSSCGSSFRSISPVESPDDNLAKVSDGWTRPKKLNRHRRLMCHQFTSKRPSQRYITINSWRTILRESKGLEVLIEISHVHRGRFARYWKGQNKDCHRCWQSKSNSSTRSEIRLIEANDDSQCRPESVTTYLWRHPEWCISSTTACEHTEAVFAKSRA